MAMSDAYTNCFVALRKCCVVSRERCVRVVVGGVREWVNAWPPQPEPGWEAMLFQHDLLDALAKSASVAYAYSDVASRKTLVCLCFCCFFFVYFLLFLCCLLQFFTSLLRSRPRWGVPLKRQWAEANSCSDASFGCQHCQCWSVWHWRKLRKMGTDCPHTGFTGIRATLCDPQCQALL